MVQRVRSVQRRGASGANSKGCQGEYKCKNARQFHPVSVLSKLDFVPCVFPRKRTSFLCVLSRRFDNLRHGPGQLPYSTLPATEILGTPLTLDRTVASFYNRRPADRS